MLDARRAAFVQHYVYGQHAGNAAASYVDAGYSPRGANALAARLIAIDSVRQAVAAATAERDAAIKAEGIALRTERLRRYNELVTALDTVRAARGEDAKSRLIPGGVTGLVVREYKTIPNADPDKAPLTVTKDSIDTGAIAAYLNIMKQMAVERSEWSESKDKSAEPAGTQVRRIVIEEVNYGSSSATGTVEPRGTGSGLPLPPGPDGHVGAAGEVRFNAGGLPGR